MVFSALVWLAEDDWNDNYLLCQGNAFGGQQSCSVGTCSKTVEVMCANTGKQRPWNVWSMRENPINKVLFHIKERVEISLAKSKNTWKKHCAILPTEKEQEVCLKICYLKATAAHGQNLSEPHVRNGEFKIDHLEYEESVSIIGV